SAEITLSHSGQARANLPLDKLPEGIVVATLWDENENVLAERLFLNHTREAAALRSTTSKENYQTREKINYTLTLPDANTSGTFSLRVVSADLFESAAGPGQSGDLLFWQDIGYGMIARNNIDAASLLDTDLQLIMTPWARYETSTLLKKSTQQQHKVTAGQSISGRVINTSVDYTDKEVWMFLEEEGITISSTLNSDGTFEIPLPYDVYGTVNIFYQVRSEERRV